MSAQDKDGADDRAAARIVFWPAHPGGLYAADPGRADGELVHVEDAPRGASGLLCPECALELVAKKGAVRAHHFAHRGVGGGADAPACARAGETALHRLAKEIIAEAGGLHLPPVTLQTDGKTGLCARRGGAPSRKSGWSPARRGCGRT